MTLNLLWFILVAVLFIGYFILEGFDLGVGILLPFVAKDDTERRMVINTIGPHWDANEVWLLTAGGATFAAFPHWYATLFSGFYLPLFLILIALIIRGVAFEFRSKDDNPTWRKLWDWCIFFGSLIPALLWGVAFANFIRGVPIGDGFQYVGGFWDLISVYTLVGGLAGLTAFVVQGALFLSLKLEESYAEKIRKLAFQVWIPNIALALLFALFTFVFTDIAKGSGALPVVLGILVLVALALVGWMTKQKRVGLAFILNSLAILLATATIFSILFPNVMVSNIDPSLNLTIFNAASSQYTLKVMSIVALIFVPIVLAYTAWSYWVFRKRITRKAEDLHY